MSVAIGYVHGEKVHARFMSSVRAAEKYEDAIVLEEGSGPSVSDARNLLVRDFLDSGRDWLYMCDTDTVFEVDTISRMLRRGKQIISALIYVNHPQTFPMMYNRIADVSVGIGMFQQISGWKHNECIRADAVGAGCLLAHRDVYLEIEKRMPNPAAIWFQETSFIDTIVGEDFTFCMRAAECGFEIYVDTAVRVGHIKPRVI